MIDLHTHIIPNIDDGSKSMEDTMELLKEAENAGFSDIILSSHYIEEYYDTSEEKREFLIKEISQNAKIEEINLNLHIGNEIYFSENILDLINNKNASTINKSRYVLFEFPMNAKPMNINDCVYELLQNKFVPILAHPERYSFIQNEPKLIYDLIEMGVLMQCNFASIIGRYGKRAQIIMKKMLECNSVQFLGTDVHKPHTIYEQMPDILNKIKKIIGEEKLEELTCENPSLVLNNEVIEIYEPDEMKFSLKDKIELKASK